MSRTDCTAGRVSIKIIFQWKKRRVDSTVGHLKYIYIYSKYSLEVFSWSFGIKRPQENI